MACRRCGRHRDLGSARPVVYRPFCLPRSLPSLTIGSPCSRSRRLKHVANHLSVAPERVLRAMRADRALGGERQPAGHVGEDSGLRRRIQFGRCRVDQRITLSCSDCDRRSEILWLRLLTNSGLRIQPLIPNHKAGRRDLVNDLISTAGG